MLHARVANLIVLACSLLVATLKVDSLENPAVGRSLDPVLSGLLSIFLAPRNSSEINVIFLAGLEGSGHHLLEAMLKEINYRPIWFGPPRYCQNRLGQIDTDHAQRWSKDIEIYEELKTEFRETRPGYVYVLNPRLSYPMCPGPHWSRMRRQHPRLDLLQKVAAEAGVNLHVLQLHRSLDDCLASDCLHRDFESCQEQAQTLVSNAAILAAQLQDVAPHRRHCFQYGIPEVMENSVRSVFGQQASGLVDEIFRESPPRHLRDQESGWSEWVSELEPAQQTLDAICHASAQASLQPQVSK